MPPGSIIRSERNAEILINTCKRTYINMIKMYYYKPVNKYKNISLIITCNVYIFDNRLFEKYSYLQFVS